MKNCVLFGALKMAETIINTGLIKENDIVYFFGNDISKWGKKYLKKK